MSKTYINWHAHSMSSLLDGISKPDEYAERCVELGMPGMCFTEHGNVFGLIQSYEAAKKHGLKYFPGIEAYLARKSRWDKDASERASGGRDEWGQGGPHHMGLIAYNNIGYQNLLKLSSRSFLEGYYVKGRMDLELISEHSEGIVGLSGCLSGMVQQALTRNDFDEAVRIAANLQDIFGKENFFIEVMRHGIDLEENNYPKLIEIAKLIDADVIATCDSHYTRAEQHHAHDVCLCINTKSRINTPDRFAFTGQYHLKSYEEMAQLFPEEYLDNTMKIYDKHDFKLDFNEHHIPNFAVPTKQTQADFFVDEVDRGAEFRFGTNWRENTDVVERLTYEKNVITEMGFPNYFLIVADIVGWARSQKIMAGAGRGSVAGSLVAYCMQITQVNPLKHGLPFERFLVPGRPSMPDIDLDFDDRYRDKVIEYTRQKYGYDHTAYIATYSEIGAKGAVNDVARVLNYPFDFAQKINKAMPPATFGVTKTLDECMATEEFRNLYDDDEDVRKVIDTARAFEGLWRQTGIHAAGLIVSDRPIQEYVPVMQKGEDKPIISQWDMKLIDKIGLLKIDFLGLRNLSIVDMAFELIEKNHGVYINDRYALVDEEDPEVFKALSRGENVGVFQLESPGIRQLMLGMQPSSIDDVSALLALYRPGPMGSNVHNEYVERKQKRKPTTYLHPSLRPILKDTYGLLLYQEQIMRITNEICGFDAGATDDFRKIVGKKLVKEMPKQRKSFSDAAINQSDYDPGTAQQLFSEIEHHASYSFSKNHSMAYAYTSYLTSWLRTYYPLEFMAAALSSVAGKEDRLRLYLSECKRMGFQVLPPSIGESDIDFTIKDGSTILYGFNAVKGVGIVLAKLLALNENDREYHNVYDFLRKVDPAILSRDTINHFLSAGCFDELLMGMDIPQPDLNRHEKQQMLLEEMNELGVFLSDHPFTDAMDLIAGKTTHTILELKEGHPGEKIRVAGVVTSMEKKMSKAGRRMYNLIIDDLDASIEVKIVGKYAADLPDPPFTKGDILIANGRLDKFGDDENAAITIIAFEMEKIDDGYLVGGKPISLYKNGSITLEQLNRIEAIIESTKGNSPVYLTINDGVNETKIRFNSLTSKDKAETLGKLIRGEI